MSTQAGWKTYRDFVLKIEPIGEGRYRVEAQAPSGEARAAFARPFDQRDLELLLLKVGRPRKASTLGQVPDQMQPAVEFGGRLYSAVVRGEVRDLLTRARYDAERSGQGLRVQLRLSDAPELADWPWELLYDGRDFVALSDATPIVRYLDLPRPPRPLIIEPPLRILVTVSSPHGLPALDVEEERANLERAMAALRARGMVEVDVTPDATFATLQRTLVRARNRRRPYHAWHYVGHGAYMESRGASVLAFCTPDNQLQRVGDLELGTLFNNCPEMRLVLLNACEGARPDPQDPFAGVAAGLVGRGVPAVVGMQFEITVDAARVFSEGFYEALLDGLPVDAALTAARLAVFGMPNWTEWATPVLYMRAPDGCIFDVAALARRAAETEAPEAEATEAEADQERLEALYTEALEAYYAARWERAVTVLDEIVSLQAEYRRAPEMLKEARRQYTLAEGYARGRAAYDAQDWVEAIKRLEGVVALDAGYRDAAERLSEARRRKELADLYADARQLHHAQRWQAAIQALERIRAIEADYPDPDGLLDSARAALEAEQRAQELAALYEQGLQHIDAQAWSQALGCLEQVAGLAPGYRETTALLARVRRELAPAQPGLQPPARRGARSWPAWVWGVLGAVALLLLGGGLLGVYYARQVPAARATAAYRARATSTPDARVTMTSAALAGSAADARNATETAMAAQVAAAVAAQATATSAAEIAVAATSAGRAAATAAAQATPHPQAGATRVRKADGAVMVYVPAGVFWMGRDEEDPDADDNEGPRHHVFVDGFWIDRTEVTNAQYRQCVEAKMCTLPQTWHSDTRDDYYGNPEYDDHPVVAVTWRQARQYAVWVGGRLPTEAEWEYACSGQEGSRYPWGDRPPAYTLLNYDWPGGDTAAVGSYPDGNSWCGALDVSGNVWEWTQSRYADYPYDPADGREDPDAGDGRLVRGGAFDDGSQAVRCAYRRSYDRDFSGGSLGFRVLWSPPQLGDTRTRPVDGAVMVYVPAGEFWMGSDEGNDEEQPRHRVSLDAFWIDRTEVTNAQYWQCVEAQMCSPPQTLDSTAHERYYGEPAYDGYPVIGITWHQARDYAAWVGGRLPSEAEWEYACRGPDGDIYPWGNRPPDDTLLNYGNNVSGGPTGVGSYPEGKSWCGAIDLSGNVWEWTQSLHVPYPYDPADGREELHAEGARVLRGGAYYVDPWQARCGFRLWEVPDTWGHDFGFRVSVAAQ